MKTVTVTTMPIQFVLTANNAGTISVPIAFDDDIDTVINNLIAALKPLRSDVIILENPSRSHFSDTVVKIHGKNVDLGIIITARLRVPVINARSTVDHSLDEARLARIDDDKWHINHYYDQTDSNVNIDKLSNGLIKIANNSIYLTSEKFNHWQKIIDVSASTINVDGMNFDNKQWHDCYIDLNMQNGLLTTQYINEDDDDHHFQVKVTRLIDNHTVMLHYELTPLDFDGVINVTNQFSADGEFSVNDNVINYANHDTTVTMQLVTDSDYQIKSDNHCAVQTLTINGQQAQTYGFDQIITINDDPSNETFEMGKNNNIAYWQKVWQHDLQITGELHTQKDLHYAIFKLQMMNHVDQQQLTHEQALTVMPFYNQYAPQRAQSLLQTQQQFIDQMTITDALALAYAANDYWQTTHDQMFLTTIGLPLILQVAQKCLAVKIDVNDAFLYHYLVKVISNFYDEYENEYQNVAQQLQFTDQNWQQLQQHQPTVAVDMLSQLAPQEALLLLWVLSDQMTFKADLSLVIDNYWQNVAEVHSLDQVLYAALTVNTEASWSLWQQALTNDDSLAAAAVLVATVPRLYAGIDAKNTVTITPHLPQTWDKISGKLMRLGKDYQYVITHYQIQLQTSYDANVVIDNQDYLVTPQAPLIVDYAKDPYR